MSGFVWSNPLGRVTAGDRHMCLSPSRVREGRMEFAAVDFSGATP
jgi:hypothetical protein